jgi:hypothetical protein
MNKFVFVALTTWSGLTAAASLSPGQAAPHGATHKPESPAPAAWAPAGAWTCAHNAYRSVLCP